jgi:hypothetical protein
MVPRDTTSSSCAIVYGHVVRFRQCEVVNPLRNAESRAEGLFDDFVFDKFKTPEESLATNIANMWMGFQELLQKLTKVFSLDAYIFAQILFSNNLLNLP